MKPLPPIFKQEDDAEDGCCMCDLCWRYGWHHAAPWYAKVRFNIRKWWHYRKGKK